MRRTLGVLVVGAAVPGRAGDRPLLGVRLLREHLSTTSVLGLAVVVVGLVLVSLPARDGAPPPTGAAPHTVSS